METRYGIVRFLPEFRYTQDGTPVCNLQVEGQKANLVRLVAFGEVAEEMAEEISINDEIVVTGYFKEWTFNGETTRNFIVKEWSQHR